MRFVHRIVAASVLANTVLVALAQDQPAKSVDDAPFTLDLPEWSPDPTSLPPELRPLDIDRPELPDHVVEELDGLEARIEELKSIGLTAETVAGQDAALDEAIGLAARVLAIRERHQGNAEGLVRWRDARGDALQWYEVTAAGQSLDVLRRMRGLSAEQRREVASIAGTDAEVARLHADGAYGEALELTRRQLAIRSETLGPRHPGTILSMSNLGTILYAQGEVTEAEPYYEQVLEGNRRSLGEDHPETITSMNNMGYFLAMQGRLAEAEPYLRRTLQGRRRVSDDLHSKTLLAIANIGSLLRMQGKFAEAEPFERCALARRRELLGDADPSTLMSVSNLGMLLKEQGRYAEAESFHRQALTGRRRVLGDDHPATLGSLNNLGTTLVALGRLSDAEACHRRALEGQSAVLGADHPNALLSATNLGAVYQQLGRYAEAEQYHRRALEGFTSVFGDEHPRTVAAKNNLGLVLSMRGRFAEAERCVREALETHLAVVGNDHPDTLTTICNLAFVLEARGRMMDAEIYYRQALDGSLRLFGEEHSQTLTDMSNLSALLHAEGRFAEAEPYARRAFEVRLRVSGEDHPLTLMAMNNLAAVLQAKRELDMAETLYRTVIDGRRRVLGPDHPLTLTTLASLGEVCLHRQEYADAERHFRTAMVGHLEVLGPEHPETLQSMNDLALALAEQGKRSEAERLYRRALEGLELLHGGSHRTTLITKHNLAILLQDDDRGELAVPLYRESLAAAESLRADILGGTQERAALAGKLQLHNIAELFAQLLAELDRSPEALAIVERGRSRAAIDLLQRDASGFRERLQEGDDDARLRRYDTAVEGQRDALAALREAEASLAATESPEELLELVKQRRRELGENTAAVYAELRGMIPVGDPLTTEQILAGLADDEILLSYVWTSERVIVLAAHGETVDGFTIAEDDEAEDALRAHLRDLRDGLSDPSATIDPDQVEAIRAALMPEGLRPLVDGATRVVVVADGTLHGIPMEAVLAGPFVYAPSATVYLDRAVASRASTPGGIDRALILGDPIFHGKWDRDEMLALTERGFDEIEVEASALDQVRLHGGTLSPLPWTRVEASAVATAFRDAGVQPFTLLGTNATAPRLRRIIDDPPRYLHLATHGLMGNADRPTEASLALTQPDVPTVDDIGFLTLEELTGAWLGRLEGCEMVVLSACDTGRGVAKGDTVMSLPLGFFAAGAESVVASLWRVDDAATALLMTRMYENYLGKHDDWRRIHGRAYAPGAEMTKLDALAEAKRWLRELTWGELREAEARLEALVGEPVVLADASGDRGAIGARPADDGGSRSAHPFEHPYYWAAFVLYGSPD